VCVSGIGDAERFVLLPVSVPLGLDLVIRVLPALFATHVNLVGISPVYRAGGPRMHGPYIGRLCRGRACSALVLQTEQFPGVEVIAFRALLGGYVEFVQNLDRLADVHAPTFRIERKIGREQHPILTVKCKPALGPGAAAEQRGVYIEVTEVVDRTFLETLA